ncbi:P-loop containing nucleoside triphosphate hydrolase protein [Suillus fuscotomentosus]|uniref:P-loop containing nucleoside triphosphate hydrolase protein n=1 Tax=Suillus fuscotomentosus TaxID=1912939 RepID=A0AAD4DRJ3_9AGAM|nr:P-loop containing nucleoside triphosphate hydrolase protein [Suillus fuscotomentosus]KAG1890744.1 P-loop containing nucleoside triphosphate hydrolase protein [Suillus fuscotomentosus]
MSSSARPQPPRSNHTGIEEPLHHIDTLGIVVCGESGSGKSSLVNLIAGTNIAKTSPDAVGCTTGTNVYDSDKLTSRQAGTLKVKLIDTAGLDEGTQGMVSDEEARKVLKELLRTLTKQGNVHLIMYRVRGGKNIRTLRRNYELIRSQVKSKVPIVLVVTCLEIYRPEMEDWWKVNEKTILGLGMIFSGHACITTMEREELMFVERRNQSYDAVWNLIREQCRQGTIHEVQMTQRDSGGWYRRVLATICLA